MDSLIILHNLDLRTKDAHLFVKCFDPVIKKLQLTLTSVTAADPSDMMLAS